MFGVYVLHSPAFDKIYVGQSSQVATRLHFHNHGPKRVVNLIPDTQHEIMHHLYEVPAYAGMTN